MIYLQNDINNVFVFNSRYHFSNSIISRVFLYINIYIYSVPSARRSESDSTDVYLFSLAAELAQQQLASRCHANSTPHGLAAAAGIHLPLQQQQHLPPSLPLPLPRAQSASSVSASEVGSRALLAC